MYGKMIKSIYVCVALISLAACTSSGLYTEKSVGTNGGASQNNVAAVHDTPKAVFQRHTCEAKGGYYSNALGCFE